MSEAPAPGAQVQALVEVVDRLRSAGGCPWDAQQTHQSLARFAIEEAYELAEAIAGGQRDEFIDELGDVLFQVVFHARLGAEDDPAFDLDEIAERTVTKLKRRHPHVFGDVRTSDTRVIEANWDAIKATEKPERVSPLDGIPAGLPPLERAAKLSSRYARATRLDELRAARPATREQRTEGEQSVPEMGSRLLDLVIEAVAAGIDPGTALTSELAAVEQQLRAREPAAGAAEESHS